MRSTFAGLQIGLKALQAQKMGLNVAGHNIANANTEGFSRQKLSLVAGNPYTAPAFNRPASPGQIGAGVEIGEIRRVQDAFIETQLRLESQTTGEWQALLDGYEQIEMILNEPSDSGIAAALTEFWRSWQQLSLTPTDMAARSVVRQSGVLLADSISHTYTQLARYREELNAAVGVEVNHINYLAQQIADLNKQIVAVSVSGDQPNDLLDARDLLVRELSSIANIQVVTDDRLQMQISIGGSSLVQGSHVSKLGLSAESGVYEVVWAGNTLTKAEINNGELKGLLTLRDEIIDNQYLYGLDRLARGIIIAVNQLHSRGYGFDPGAGAASGGGAGDGGGGDLDPGDGGEAFPTGMDFFVAVPPADGSRAQNMQVTPEIVADDGLRLIAAASALGAPGNGENAMAIAGFLRQGLMSELDPGALPPGGDGTDPGDIPDLDSAIPDFYAALIAKLGVDSQEAKRMSANQQVLQQYLELRRESASGVSLDEEISDLIRYQHAYNAAARFMTTLDESLSIVIERMGIVGR